MGEALREAARVGDLAQLRAVLATGLDVDARDSRDHTALHSAAFNGHTACLDALLAAGASVHSVTPDGWTSLIFASMYGHEACVRVLIAAGADVNHVNDCGMTPFSFALFWGHRCILKILLRAGADVNTHDVPRTNADDNYNHDNTDAWELVDAIQKVGGWPQYVHRRRATAASIVKKAVTRDALPDAINLEIATFMEPPGGYSPALY